MTNNYIKAFYLKSIHETFFFDDASATDTRRAHDAAIDFARDALSRAGAGKVSAHSILSVWRDVPSLGLNLIGVTK